MATETSWADSLFGDLEDPDTPLDCHRHCRHWDTEGECCECHEVRTPNHSYQPPEEVPANELLNRGEDSFRLGWR